MADITDEAKTMTVILAILAIDIGLRPILHCITNMYLANVSHFLPFPKFFQRSNQRLCHLNCSRPWLIRERTLTNLSWTTDKACLGLASLKTAFGTPIRKSWLWPITRSSPFTQFSPGLAHCENCIRNTTPKS